MDGQNPYIADTSIQQPTRKFKVTFLPMGKTIEIDSNDLPYGDHGLPGSILDIAMARGIELDHACGGVCACATCHIIIREGMESCNDTTDDEEDQLDEAYGITPHSRLGCQCVPKCGRYLVVEIPGWDRDLSREGVPHGS